MGHEFGKRLHGADGGRSESERFFEAAADGVEAHGRIELPLDGVQFLDPAGETFWPANGEPHRGVVEVGVCVNETGQEGDVAHFLDGGVVRQEGQAMVLPSTGRHDEAVSDDHSCLMQESSIRAPEAARFEGKRGGCARDHGWFEYVASAGRVGQGVAG